MFEPPEFDPTSKAKLIAITFDEASIRRGSSNIEHEREVAVFDILEGNRFALDGRDGGPYTLNLSIVEDRLVFAVAQEGSDDTFTVVLSLTPLRRIMKDYFVVCETYYQAIRTAPPSRIQSIDMGRRALHDEGSRVLVERLEGQDHRRPRHGAAAVHAHLRAALEGMTGGARGRPRSAGGGTLRLHDEFGPLADGGGDPAPPRRPQRSTWSRPACAPAAPMPSPPR